MTESVRTRVNGHLKKIIQLVDFPGHPNAGGAWWQVSCQCKWSYEAGTRIVVKRAHRDHLAERRASGERYCTICRQIFPDLQAMAVHHPNYCKACESTRVARWASNNPEQFGEAKYRHHLKKYGVTPEWVAEKIATQGGLCAICGGGLKVADVRGWRPHVDHDHGSGRTRDILCFGCNAGLGQFRDDPVRLRAAAAYLERHSCSR